MTGYRDRRHFARCLAALTLAAGLALGGAANAQSPNEAAAEALFDEGRELFDAGRFAEACPKFEESQRLDPSPGTMLNLARCNEASGKTASAWSGYLAAKRAAQAAGREPIVEEATRRANELEMRLSFLTIRVERPVAGLAIHQGDIELTAASLGVRVPTDPGHYELRATAPGHVPWTGQITLEDGEREEVVIPELQPRAPTPAPAEAPPAAPISEPPPAASEGPPEPPPPPSPLPIGAVVAGAGVVVTGVGLVFGGLAENSYDAARQECPDRVGCSESAMNSRSRAAAYATTSTVLVSAGLGGLATGSILWALRASRKSRKDGVEPQVTMVRGGGCAGIRGRF